MAKRYIGSSLNEKVNLRGSIVEVWAKLMLPGNGFIEVRLIGFRFPKTKQYRWYATNLKSSMLLAEWIYPLYRLRWQIELFFKSIKSVLTADQITSGNENIALAIAYSSILSSLLASSIIIEEALAFAHIELKSITRSKTNDGIFYCSSYSGTMPHCKAHPKHIITKNTTLSSPFTDVP